MSASAPIPNWLDHRGRACPDQPAIVAGAEVMTYGVLARRARLTAGRLARLGVTRGSRVAVLLRGGAAFAEIMHGLARLGAVLVPLDRRLTPHELRQQCEGAGAELLVYDHGTRELAAQIEPTPRRLCCGGDAIAGDGALDAIIPADDTGDARHDLASVHSIIFTSGSSGTAKGVLLTYGNHYWSATASAFNLGLQRDDRWLACLPFCHVGGLSILLRSVIYGTTAVIHDGFDPERVNYSIEAERVTIISVVANMLQRMLAARGPRPYPPWLRCVLLGGGPAPRPLLEDCAACGVPVIQTYGLTEAASQVTALAPGDALRKLGSAGQPLLATEVALAGVRTGLGREAVGEITIRGPTITRAYLDGRATTDAEGWLHTGDLGCFDAEGFLYVIGRRDELIISGGENIHPAEIEAALQAHPAVAEVCVVGVPDPRWGEAVTACVRLRPGAALTAAALQAAARRLLAGFKVPRRVLLVEDFPRTAAGKIMRGRVRAQLAGAAPAGGLHLDFSVGG
ncbi:MAG: o-succinylbenzoate--CoA ligase [Deltaproteobacteria bacterium]|nr:o-succinylbenzoate--CoA ligase [Deltaproteobacteria bacterium]